MLDASQTEIVSREALVPPESPPGHRPLQSVDWSAVLGYSIDDDGDGDGDAPDDISVDSPSEEKPAEISFRLFAPTKHDSAAPVHTFILPRSPPPEQALLLSGDLALDNTPQPSHFSDADIQLAHATHRPLRYYLTPPLDDHRAAQIRQAAVSGEDVLNASAQRWPGSELPWRVIHLSLVDSEKKKKKKSQVAHEGIPIGEKRRRHRPSKAVRIVLRRRRAEEEAKASKNAIKKKNKKKKAEVASAVEAAVHKRTEEEDREKKTRLNRLKKARRRLKEKEKKTSEGDQALVLPTV
ncbi:hypothetical protein H072_735 [Dactylellina haptotyla CBS 200.50]|uniref:Uncharacterized protein n=1 Tax=Dactylellina haptotyla (strain CBS 200.50) TaxID=1284197 RepID=S8AWE3_DACHA|nr:hypothetical protein H072_735 [Dactylellina haptotyla CBS 200.50]